MALSFPKVASLRTPAAFAERVRELGVDLPIDEELATGEAAPLAQAIESRAGRIGNRFCILPMEGWDGESDGRPTELTRRRWRNFGDSGAKLIWGGEAVAVRHDGRANPNQLLINDATAAAIEALREELASAHRERFDTDDDLCVGLQITHSGRYARPNEKARVEPRIAYRHPVLDPRVGVEDDGPVLSDSELDQLVDDFVAAAVLAQKAGFAFVDVKHCHGYLGHELLSGFDRPGKYGGDFEGRTRFLRNIVAGVRAEAPGLEIGVRLSVFDFSPYKPGEDRIGVPEAEGVYQYAFGGDGGGGIDLTEPHRFVDLLRELGIDLLCTTAGSPYYNPHIQRPATFPPSDGYLPPEDPLVGVARQIDATRRLKSGHPDMIVVGSGYSYLQDWLAHAGQAVAARGWADAIGLGRMVLSYHDLPADALAGKKLARKRICRTFSDCTTAPRNGMVSGCYPLDPYYKDRPERKRLAELNKPPD
ncbi:NADPH dehydrogenase [Planctomycetes bacterium MalM25]|nr:NADPH dehydrogenase [Planctomycetes bacterium MalM25]